MTMMPSDARSDEHDLMYAPHNRGCCDAAVDAYKKILPLKHVIYIEHHHIVLDFTT